QRRNRRRDGRNVRGARPHAAGRGSGGAAPSRTPRSGAGWVGGRDPGGRERTARGRSGGAAPPSPARSRCGGRGPRRAAARGSRPAAMTTVPTVRLADAADAAGLPELLEEIQLAVTDVAGAVREGLLAMSVAAGMAVMQAMFEAEIAEACGPKGKHDPGRAAVRHGTGRGAVT